MNRIGIGRDVGAPTGQLLAKSYRARAGRPHPAPEPGEALGQRLRREHSRPPEPLAALVERGEDFAAAGVQHRQRSVIRSGERPAEGVEAADTAHREARTRRQAESRGNTDADADEGAGATPDRDPPHQIPAARRGGRVLDLGQQRGRVAWAAILAEAEDLLVEDRATASRADRRIGGRRVEADDRLLRRGQASR